jgi:cysteine desulfurase
MDPVYLDHAATTPLRAEVRAAMEPYLGDRFGNASSLHRWGREARSALDQARAEVAEAIGARPSEVHFVRGGTESDNLALIGSWLAQRDGSSSRAVVVSSIEHSAVLDAAVHLETAEGANVLRLAVSPTDGLDVASLLDILRSGPALVSVMWVNNETGMTLPVERVAELSREHGAVVHTDAAQAVGKVPVSVADTPVDLLTATGHKINGPKGTGILFVREGTPITPLLFGGGQERRRRPGTEDVAGAVGFATALRLAIEEQEATADRLAKLRSDFERRLRQAIPDLRVNCGDAHRSPHVSSVGLAVADGAAFLAALDLEGIAASGGSACHSGAHRSSHVLSALYGSDDRLATIRFSFGIGTTEAETRRAVDVTAQLAARFATPA